MSLSKFVFKNYKYQIIAALFIFIIIWGLVMNQPGLHQLLSWGDPLAGFATLLLALFLWFNSIRKDWENKLPKKLDAAISLLFISPNMHKVHHHWKQPFTDSNYGAVLSIWDRLLGTFMHLDHAAIRYGLDRYYPNEEDENFMALMKKPFGKME